MRAVEATLVDEEAKHARVPVACRCACESVFMSEHEFIGDLAYTSECGGGHPWMRRPSMRACLLPANTHVSVSVSMSSIRL